MKNKHNMRQGAALGVPLTALAIAVAAPVTSAQNAPLALEEVIVTAQKREEGLQDVPISVQAFSQQRIEALSAQERERRQARRAS